MAAHPPPSARPQARRSSHTGAIGVASIARPVAGLAVAFAATVLLAACSGIMPPVGLADDGFGPNGIVPQSVPGDASCDRGAGYQDGLVAIPYPAGDYSSADQFDSTPEDIRGTERFDVETGDADSRVDPGYSAGEGSAAPICSLVLALDPSLGVVSEEPAPAEDASSDAPDDSADAPMREDARMAVASGAIVALDRPVSGVVTLLSGDDDVITAEVSAFADQSVDLETGADADGYRVILTDGRVREGAAPESLYGDVQLEFGTLVPGASGADFSLPTAGTAFAVRPSTFHTVLFVAADGAIAGAAVLVWADGALAG